MANIINTGILKLKNSINEVAQINSIENILCKTWIEFAEYNIQFRNKNKYELYYRITIENLFDYLQHLKRIFLTLEYLEEDYETADHETDLASAYIGRCTTMLDFSKYLQGYQGYSIGTTIPYLNGDQAEMLERTAMANPVIESKSSQKDVNINEFEFGQHTISGGIGYQNRT